MQEGATEVGLAAKDEPNGSIKVKTAKKTWVSHIKRRGYRGKSILRIKIRKWLYGGEAGSHWGTRKMSERLNYSKLGNMNRNKWFLGKSRVELDTTNEIAEDNLEE